MTGLLEHVFSRYSRPTADPDRPSTTTQEIWVEVARLLIGMTELIAADEDVRQRN